MEKKVCVFLADGFEEIEGLTVVDILRRADIKVETVSVTGEKEIHGSHEINVQADTLFEEANFENAEMLVLREECRGQSVCRNTEVLKRC